MFAAFQRIHRLCYHSHCVENERIIHDIFDHLLLRRKKHNDGHLYATKSKLKAFASNNCQLPMKTEMIRHFHSFLEWTHLMFALFWSVCLAGDLISKFQQQTWNQSVWVCACMCVWLWITNNVDYHCTSE